MLSSFTLLDVLKRLTEKHKATITLEPRGWLIANLELVAQECCGSRRFLAKVVVNIRRDDHLSCKRHRPRPALANIPKQVTRVGGTAAGTSTHNLDGLHQRLIGECTEKLYGVKDI